MSYPLTMTLLWLLDRRRGRQPPEVIELGHVGGDGLVEVAPVVVVDDLFTTVLNYSILRIVVGCICFSINSKNVT